MNKSVALVSTLSAFALCLMIFTSPVAVLAMDVDELINKNIEATGGLEKIKSVNSMEIVGNVLVQGMEIPFTMVQKRPGKMKMEAMVMGMTMTQGFADGEGWAINPMTGGTEPEPMPEVEAKSFELQADMDGPLVDYKEKGAYVTLTNKQLKEVQCHYWRGMLQGVYDLTKTKGEIEMDTSKLETEKQVYFTMRW